MITDDPERITLYDLNGPVALALARAVELVRLDPRCGFPLPGFVRAEWLTMPVVRVVFPNPDTITVEHVGRLLRLAREAGLL